MNVQLDRRLGRIWDKVRERLSREKVSEFLDAAVQAKSFDDLPEVYKNLVLEIESGSKQRAA